MSQKCYNCGVCSDELKCYECYKKLRDIFVPIHVMEIQQKFIKENQEELIQNVKQNFEHLKKFNGIEKVSMCQKKYCEVRDDLRESQESLNILKAQQQEIKETNVYKKEKIQMLKQYLEQLKIEQKKSILELQKRDKVLLRLKKKKVKQNYNLRVINHSFQNWSINNELEKIEIPFYSKMNYLGTKQYQNYILFKKKYSFLSQVQQQQFLFSLNQIALFIYSLQSIFNISSQFPLIKKPREQIAISNEVRLYDENFRIIYDENIVYLYLNYKLILQKFNIMETRNPYFFFDFSYFKERIISRQPNLQLKQRYDIKEIEKSHHDQNNIINTNQNQNENFDKENNHSNRFDINRISLSSDNLELNFSPLKSSPQKSSPLNRPKQKIILSDSKENYNLDNIQIKSLSNLEELTKCSSSLSNENLPNENLSNDHVIESGKTYRLLFVKSPLIKIDYEENLKQKQIKFKDPFLYQNKVVTGGWELYDVNDY